MHAYCNVSTTLCHMSVYVSGHMSVYVSGGFSYGAKGL